MLLPQITSPCLRLLSCRTVTIETITAVLTHTADLTPTSPAAGRFHGQGVESMPLPAYIARIGAHFHCSNAALVAACELLSRHLVALPFSPQTGHRLFLAAVLCASKFHDDEPYSMTHYADVGGVTIRELKALETAFLRAIDWRLHISVSDFAAAERALCAAAASVPSRHGAAARAALDAACLRAPPPRRPQLVPSPLAALALPLPVAMPRITTASGLNRVRGRKTIGYKRLAVGLDLVGEELDVVTKRCRDSLRF